MLIAAIVVFGRALGGEPALPVRTAWVGTLAATSRNLSVGGAVRAGKPVGPWISGALTTDWPFSALVGGFLLDDVTAPRLASHQLVGWAWAWPGGKDTPWKPRLAVGVGLWEQFELDSLAQAFRTEDYGVYASLHTGAQFSLLWPGVGLGFGLRPFATTAWWHDEGVFPTAFQFTNAVLDVDLTVDLTRLFGTTAPP